MVYYLVPYIYRYSKHNLPGFAGLRCVELRLV
jgi:hypothetical protein